MRFDTAVALVGTCLTAAQATTPGAEFHARPDPRLRLIKTSESDPGQWINEKDIYKRFISRKKGFLDITDRPHLATSKIARRQTSGSFPSQVQNKEEVERLLSQVSVAQPQTWLQTLTNFHTRQHTTPTGKEAATWLFNEVKTVAGTSQGINVTQFNHKFDQPSVIARIPGNSPNLVIAGAHFDSTGPDAQSRSPGADDNGSGTVVLLEALRVLAQSGIKPQNTLEFHFYAAEEAGLLGSMDIFSNYKSTGKRVVAMLNQDGASASPNNKSSIITDNTDPGLNEFVRTVATAYIGAPSDTKCDYACSDHASANQNGFPAAMLAADSFDTVDLQVLHTANDSLDKIQWPTVLRHAKFTVAFMVEAASIGGSGGGGPTTTVGVRRKPAKPTGQPVAPTGKAPEPTGNTATGQGCRVKAHH